MLLLVLCAALAMALALAQTSYCETALVNSSHYGVALTMIPPRFSSVHFTLFSWLNQSIPPQGIYIFVPSKYKRFRRKGAGRREEAGVAGQVGQAEDLPHAQRLRAELLGNATLAPHVLSGTIRVVEVLEDLGPVTKFAGVLSLQAGGAEGVEGAGGAGGAEDAEGRGGREGIEGAETRGADPRLFAYWIFGDDDMEYDTALAATYLQELGALGGMGEMGEMRPAYDPASSCASVAQSQAQAVWVNVGNLGALDAADTGESTGVGGSVGTVGTEGALKALGEVGAWSRPCTGLTLFAAEERLQLTLPGQGLRGVPHIQGVDSYIVPSAALRRHAPSGPLSARRVLPVLRRYHSECPASFYQDDYVVSFLLHLAGVTMRSVKARAQGQGLVRSLAGVSESRFQMHVSEHVFMRELITQQCIVHTAAQVHTELWEV
ncbi:hypothetical protein B484DRAFT_447042 [Ochromonadaceae sp. CCMP2298]|nr:hypothetical protein B484DRAFT_447042 [Ochromonadaceae sp. CCMP2298]